MRAYDLALMLALFGAIMGMLDYSGIWTGGTVDTGPEIINQSAFEDIKVIENPGAVDIITQTMSAGWTSLLLLFNVLLGIIYIKDIIINLFGGGEAVEMVANGIQMGVWLTYAVALVQMKSGKSVKSME